MLRQRTVAGMLEIDANVSIPLSPNLYHRYASKLFETKSILADSKTPLLNATNSSNDHNLIKIWTCTDEQETSLLYALLESKEEKTIKAVCDALVCLPTFPPHSVNAQILLNMLTTPAPKTGKTPLQLLATQNDADNISSLFEVLLSKNYYSTKRITTTLEQLTTTLTHTDKNGHNRWWCWYYLRFDYRSLYEYW